MVKTYACKQEIAISKPVIKKIIKIGTINNIEDKPTLVNIIQANSDKIFNNV